MKHYERFYFIKIVQYGRQAGPGLRTRIPFIESVLVVDIREKVREFKAERIFTTD